MYQVKPPGFSAVYGHFATLCSKFAMK